LGRWISADWSATPIPVPYADFGDPQSLNLYGYVGGNPSSKADPDGHCCTAGEFGQWLDKQLAKFESTNFGKVYSFTQSLSPMQTTNPLAIGHFIANSANIGTATGTALGGDHTTMQKVDAIAHDVKAAGELTLVLATAGKSMMPAVATAETAAASTLKPGPFAGESVPLRGPQRDFTSTERAEINRIGNETGCHTCGTTDPGTKSGNFIVDHQPPVALAPGGTQFQGYPQCTNCSFPRQANEVRQALKDQQ
jgi:hypothetical protein